MNYINTIYADICATVAVSGFNHGGVGEYNMIIECTDPSKSLAEQVHDLQAALAYALDELTDAVPVFKRYFLSDALNQGAALPSDEGCAVSVIGQPPLNGTKVALWVYAQTDMRVSLRRSGLWCAEHGSYRHLWCGGAAAPDLHSELATMALFGDYVIRLDNEGCTLADNCQRTWFFVRDIDVNYKGVVVGRNDVFRRSGMSQLTHFIASTGIAGVNPDNKVTVTMDAYAVDGVAPAQVRYLHASDFLNSTMDYGVAFERGTAIQYGDRRHILISGTASINNKGEVMHPGDVVLQTGRMLQNVEALVAEGGGTMADLTHIIVYLRDIADYAVVRRIFDQRFPSTPLVIVQAPVCRPGWLIEMECMAITADADARFAAL